MQPEKQKHSQKQKTIKQISNPKMQPEKQKQS